MVGHVMGAIPSVFAQAKCMVNMELYLQVAQQSVTREAHTLFTELKDIRCLLVVQKCARRNPNYEPIREFREKINHLLGTLNLEFQAQIPEHMAENPEPIDLSINPEPSEASKPQRPKKEALSG